MRTDTLAQGVHAVNMGVVGRIVTSWVVTIPAGAVLSIVFFLILRALLGGA